MTPVRTRLTLRPVAALAVAAGAILFPTSIFGGLTGTAIPFGFESSADAATQVAPPARPQSPPTGPQAPPARPTTPPPARPTTPVPAPTADEDLPEGLRVRPVPPMRPVTGGPGIHFEVLDHHFGKMTNAETRRTTFAFVNTGDQPLVIHDVSASCACTRPSIGQRTFAPGERGVIDVDFTPPTGGHQAKAMSVVSNALAPNNLVRIRVIGDVEAVLSFEPKVHDVGELELGRPYSGTFEVIADAASTWFDGASVRGRDMTLAAVGDLPQQGSLKLAVGFPGTLPWGRVAGAAMISTRGTSDEEGTQTITKELPIRVVGVVVDDIRADDYTIQLGFVDPHATFEGEIRIFHKDGKSIELVGVTVEPMSVTMRGVADAEYRADVRPSTDPEKPGQILRLRGQSRGPQGFLSGNIKFRVLVDGQPYGQERSVGINGRVAPPERQIPMTPAGR